MRVKRLLPSLMPEMLLTLVIAASSVPPPPPLKKRKKLRFLVVKVLCYLESENI